MKRNTKQIILDRRQFLTRTVVAGGAALGLGLAGFPAIAVPRKTMIVGYVPILDHLVLAISHARDNAAFLGIDVEPRLFQSWGTLAGALEAGVIDAAFMLSPLAMGLFNRGVPISSILVGHRHGSALTVRVDATIQGPADLAGKTIAVPTKISTHTALLDAYLRTGGLSLASVTTRDVAPPLMVAAMLQGSIDAFIVAEPFCAKAEQDGVGRILRFSKDILSNHICCIVVIRNDVLATNRDGLQEWVNSLVRAGQWIDQKKLDSGAGEIAQLAGRYMPHTEKVILGGLQHPDDRILYKDLHPRQADFQAVVAMSRQSGLIQEVDLHRFINDTFFKNVGT